MMPEDLVALRTDDAVPDFHPYVLCPTEELAGILGGHVLCFVATRRLNGILLALPTGVMAEDALTLGMQAQPLDFLGPSTTVTVQGASMDFADPFQLPALPGSDVEVLLVDFSPDVARHLKELEEASEDIVQGFSMDDTAVPEPLALIEIAFQWISGLEAGSRVQYYSAEEDVPETEPVEEEATVPTAKGKAKARPGGTLPGARKIEERREPP